MSAIAISLHVTKAWSVSPSAYVLARNCYKHKWPLLSKSVSVSNSECMYVRNSCI